MNPNNFLLSLTYAEFSMTRTTLHDVHNDCVNYRENQFFVGRYRYAQNLVTTLKKHITNDNNI